MKAAIAKLLPGLIPAIVGGVLTALGGIFAFGQQLGHAEATALYWERYATSLERRCE